MKNLLEIHNLAFLGFYFVIEYVFNLVLCNINNIDISLANMIKGFIGSLLLLFFL